MIKIETLLIMLLMYTCLSTQAATPDGPLTFDKNYPGFAPWGIKRAVTKSDRQRIASFRSGSKTPVYSTKFLKPTDLDEKWILKSDDEPWRLQSCRRPENFSTSDHGLQIWTRAATDCRCKWSTGSMWSNWRQKCGFFEATIKIADCPGLNNAFWLTTTDPFEIDICETHYPSTVRSTLHNNQLKPSKSAGFSTPFVENLSKDYHDYGVLWTEKDIVFEVDGEPIAAIDTNGSIQGAADIRFSTAVTDFAGKIPEHPENHCMRVQSMRVFSLD
ncbi:MAG: glycoside hydrolase family 16 protein [Candidatus Obscuribacterales bacterium]|nr:glycoside hydrolase family 16 protein [Candidatus Obscuribacterales bacterium]